MSKEETPAFTPEYGRAADAAPEEKNERIRKLLSESVNMEIREHVSPGSALFGPALPGLSKADSGENFRELFEKAAAELPGYNPYPKDSGAWKLYDDAVRLPAKGRPYEKIRTITDNGAFFYTALRNPCTYDFGDAAFFLLHMSSDALTASCIASVSIIGRHCLDRERMEKWLADSEEHYQIVTEEPLEEEKDAALAFALCAEAGMTAKKDEAENRVYDEDDYNMYLPYIAKQKAVALMKKLEAADGDREARSKVVTEAVGRVYPETVHAYECIRSHFSHMSVNEISRMMQTAVYPACEAMTVSEGMAYDIIGRFLTVLCAYLEALGADNIDPVLSRLSNLYIQTRSDAAVRFDEDTAKWVDDFEEDIRRAMTKVPYVIRSESVRVFYSMAMRSLKGSGTLSVISFAGHDSFSRILVSEKYRKKMMARFVASYGKRERPRVKKALSESVRDIVSVIRSKMENPERRYRTASTEIWREWVLYLASFLTYCNEDILGSVYGDSLDESRKAKEALDEAEKLKEEASAKEARAAALERENAELKKKLEEKAERDSAEEKERNRRLSELNRALLDSEEKIASLEEEKRRNRKEIDALTKAFSEFESETGGGEENAGDESEETRALAKRLNDEYRGIFIGGHQGFLARLMTLYPSWKSYSYSDKAKMDPNAFRAADAVVIFAEHLSHSILFEGKKFMKASDAVPIYTFTTNLDAITEKIAETLERKKR